MTHPLIPRTGMAPAATPELEAARERTIRLLTDRYADDTLSVDEFERRLDLLYRAQSPAELDHLVRDVLVAAPRSATTVDLRAARPAPAPPPAPAPAATGRPRRFLCAFAESVVAGPLALTPHVDVDSWFGNHTIDLRDADFPPGGIDLEIVAAFAEVRILVPKGVWVEGAPNAVLASFANEAADRARYEPGAPQVRLRGSVWLADVKVRAAPAGPPTRQAWKLGRVR